MGVRCLPKHPREIVLDLDAMGHRLHGFQEGRHFNTNYDDYCQRAYRKSSTRMMMRTTTPSEIYILFLRY